MAYLLRCEKRSAKCGYFTDGREYVARRLPGNVAGRALEVRDDHGSLRVVVPDCPSAHLPPPFREFTPETHEQFGGRFVIVREV